LLRIKAVCEAPSPRVCRFFAQTRLSKMRSGILLSFVDFAANFLACFSSLFLKRVFDDGPRWNVLRQAV